ncbi:hypothetical protein PENTCL1PPCAC_25367, partial [Pristionchus entomophagus]
METSDHSIETLPSSSKKDKCMLLFEEEWSKIYPNELVISWYYFPYAGNKRVDTQKIRAIYYIKQNFDTDVMETKMWGMSLSLCWWACDENVKFLKGAEKNGFYNVAIDVGGTTMKGFTTGNLRAFLSVLCRQCGPDVVCRE